MRRERSPWVICRRVRSNVRLYRGWFEDTLPAFCEQHPGPIAFLHLDADLYSSTRTVFDLLGDGIVPGTVIASTSSSIIRAGAKGNIEPLLSSVVNARRKSGIWDLSDGMNRLRQRS